MKHLSARGLKPSPNIRRERLSNVRLIDIQVQNRAVKDIVLDPRNPKQHPPKQVDQLADSIREFGFLVPVVVDATGKIVIGHGRVLAAKKLGMAAVPAIEIHHLSSAQLTALRIADNKLAMLIGMFGFSAKTSSNLSSSIPTLTRPSQALPIRKWTS